jgi:hypothetical protein
MGAEITTNRKSVKWGKRKPRLAAGFFERRQQHRLDQGANLLKVNIRPAPERQTIQFGMLVHELRDERVALRGFGLLLWR